MKLTRIELEEIGDATSVSLSTSRFVVRDRRGLLLRIWDDRGNLGVGEASPLPGFSRETLDEVRAELSRLSPANFDVPPRLPAARFAWDTAQLDLSPTSYGTRSRPLSVTTLLTAETPEALAAQAHAARHAPALKLKLLAGAWSHNVARLTAVRRVYAGPLRIDANGGGGVPLHELLPQLAAFEPDFVEEVGALELLEKLDTSPVTLALDESLLLPDGIERALKLGARGLVRVLVLKPMALGGIEMCRSLAQRAKVLGMRVVVTHLLDGPVAHEGARRFARELDDETHGLGVHPFLDAMAPRDDFALIVAEGRRHTWREVCGVRSNPITRATVVGDLTETNTLAILRHLEHATPMLLLHPRSTEHERERMKQMAEPALVPEVGAVIFTSGTTGMPKGAVLSSRALQIAADAVITRLGITRRDRLLLALTPAHVGGLSILIRARRARCAVVLAPEGQRLDAETLAKTIASERVTIASLVPTMLHKLLDHGWTPPPTLRAVMLGGAPATQTLLERARVRGVVVLTTYGMTETCAAVTLSSDGEAGAGTPLAGCEVRISARGTIEVRSSALFDGYVGHLRETDWFDTNDLGVIDEHGCVHVLARRSDLIISGGENVYPSEVEGVMESCSGVARACVFGVEDPLWGEVVCAALVLRPGCGLDAPALSKRLETQLARFKRPRHIVIVDSLAENHLGKLDRARVRERASSLLRPVDADTRSVDTFSWW